MNSTLKQQYLFTTVQKQIGQIAIAKSEDKLVKICSEIASNLEVSYFSHGLMWADDFHHPKFKIISNYKKGWLEEYDERSYYSIDPRARECMTSLTPVFWNTEKPYMDQLQPDAKEMMENAHEHNVYSGVTAPIFSFKDVKGAFSFGLTSSSCLRKQKKQLELISPFANYLGVFVHQAMMKILKIEETNSNILLSEREKDCLCWAADGKTTSEIASFLCLSESTIKYHFRNAMEKLGAKNTTQALSIAILKGYIQPILSVR
jgi:DNA-binding CsgD family transcriptional regulator